MTSNMINYRNYEESVRHNREMERLTGEQQAEAARHNKVVEEETQRTNYANEQIKTRANAINEIHYGKQDFENARHNLISEYYSLQLPEAAGKSKADVDKTKSETNLNYAKAEESGSKTSLNESSISLNKSKEALNYAQSLKVGMDTLLSKAKIGETNANTNLLVTKQQLGQKDLDWYTYNQVLKGVDAGSKALNALTNVHKLGIDKARAITSFISLGK